MGKGKTVRQIHHFTDGLWSQDMDARADMSSSVNSCRKLENFQVDQYGEAIRRPGLQYVGGSLGECLAIDPMLSFPDWDSLTDSELITPVDQYGSEGMEELRQISYPADWWILCDWLVYCFGPAVEGVGMQDYKDRYTVRWRAKLEDGWIYYGKVGEPWVKVSASLYPTQMTEAIGLGFCFDVDGLPVFATQIASDVEVRRFVATVPTTYTFNGVGPKLYLNANVQWQNTIWDVVCYYCDSGDLAERFQRDNFNTKYVLYHSVDNYLTRVKNVDVSPVDYRRLYVACNGSVNFRGMFRSSLYPLWPEFDSSTLTVAILGDGLYEPMTFVDAISDPTTLSVSISSDGLYEPVTIGAIEEDQGTLTVSIASDGLYEQSVIPTGPYSETAIASVSIATDGDYVLGAISGGSYTETTTATISINTDGDYTV